MDLEKGFMLKKDKIKWKEREGNLLSVRKETIEKQTGAVEVRSHQVFQTEMEAIDAFNSFQVSDLKVTSKKQANKDLKEKLEKLKENQSIINGEALNVTEMRDSALEKSMMEDDLWEEKAHYAKVQKQKKEQEMKETVKQEKMEQFSYESLPEELKKVYLVMKEGFDELKTTTNLALKNQMLSFFKQDCERDTEKKKLFEEAFKQEYQILFNESSIELQPVTPEDNFDTLFRKISHLASKAGRKSEYHGKKKTVKLTGSKADVAKYQSNFAFNEYLMSMYKELETNDKIKNMGKILEETTYQELMDAFQNNLDPEKFLTEKAKKMVKIDDGMKRTIG